MSKNGKAQVDPEPTGSTLINPVTVAEMVAAYNRAIQKVEDGYRYLAEAQDELTRVFGTGKTFSVMDREHYHNSNAQVAKMQLHRAVWRAMVDKLDVWKILPLKDAEELRELLDKGQIVKKHWEGHREVTDVERTLPPINDEEVLAMLEAMHQNKSDYAKRFALEVYEWLTPASKSNSRWDSEYVTNKRNGRDELGKKVIIGWMIRAGFGKTPFQVNYGHEDKLAAMDRLFALLDSQPLPEVNTYHSPSVVAINNSPSRHSETQYFQFEACMNGNLHIWFKRMDLVQKLNQLAGNQVDLKQPKHKVKRGDHTEVKAPYDPNVKAEKYEEAFYWTSEPVVKIMLDKVPLPTNMPLLMSVQKFLEPSAGEGHIADCLVAAGVGKGQIWCVEKNYDRVAALLRKGYPNVRDIDFLKFDTVGWNYIYMNPPFNQEQSIAHVMHAYKLLDRGGWICAIMSEHDFTASTPSATYFQEWSKRIGGKNEPLPKNSFAPAGTTWDTRVWWAQKKGL